MLRLFLTCFIFLVITPSIAQTKQERLDSVFTLLHENQRFNGSILVAEKGVPIFEQFYGVQNIELEKTLTESSVFMLNSVSKQFTAMAIIKLNGLTAYNATACL